MKVRYIFLAIALFVFIAGCAHKKSTLETMQKPYSSVYTNALKNASGAAEKVLKKAQDMVRKKVIVRGSCWDYINAVYHNAGFGYKKRHMVYKSKKRGPYADLSLLRAGDWLYHVNYSYGRVGHSGIFIRWIDKKNKLALMLSYAGERRKMPARYKVYDLSSVYTIIRAE